MYQQQKRSQGLCEYTYARRCECGAHAENIRFADVRVSLQSQPYFKLLFIVSLLFSSTFFQQSLYNSKLKKRISFIWLLNKTPF